MARGRRHITPSAVGNPHTGFIRELKEWKSAELAIPSNAYRDERERHFDRRIRERVAARMQDLIIRGDMIGMRQLAHAAGLDGDAGRADMVAALRLHRALLEIDALPEDFPDSVLGVSADDVIRAGGKRHGGAYADVPMIDSLRTDPIHTDATAEDWARAARALLTGPKAVTRGAGHAMLPIPIPHSATWDARLAQACDPQRHIGVIQHGSELELWELRTLQGTVDGTPRAISAGYRLLKVTTPTPDPEAHRRWLGEDLRDLPMVAIDPETYAVDLPPSSSSDGELGAVLDACRHLHARWDADDTGDRVLNCEACGAHHLDVIPAPALDTQPSDIRSALRNERFYAILAGTTPPKTWAQAREIYADERTTGAVDDLAFTLFADH